MAEDTNVRIGFVGTGSMGQCAHLVNYTDLPGCEVAALAELRPELGREVATRYSVPNVYTDAREMLDKESLDALVSIQHYRIHGQVLPQLFEAGLPILAEKPLARSVETGERILEALEGSQARLALGYHKRSDPAVMAAHAGVEAITATGEIGEKTYVRLSMPPGDWIASGFDHLIKSGEPMPGLDEDPPDPDENADTGRRIEQLVNYYVHQINLLRHLLGGYRVEYVDPKGVVVAVTSADGVPGLIEMGAYRTTIDWQESALVAFQRGFVAIDLPAPLAVNRPGAVRILRDPGEGFPPEESSVHLPWKSAMRQQAENFIAYVRGESTPLCEGPEALADLRVARDIVRKQQEHSE